MTQRRRDLELKVVNALASTAAAERLRQQAEERAERAADLKGGILGLHQPRAQHSDDHRAPLLFCSTCPEAWPCRTIQFIYAFGEFAPPADEA